MVQFGTDSNPSNSHTHSHLGSPAGRGYVMNRDCLNRVHFVPLKMQAVGGGFLQSQKTCE